MKKMTQKVEKEDLRVKTKTNYQIRILLKLTNLLIKLKSKRKKRNY